MYTRHFFSPLTISDAFRPLGKRLRAALVVTGRACWYLVSFRWQPREDYLVYPTLHRFSNSYVVIDYRFRRALWYRFKGICTTTRRGPLVLNLRHLRTQQVRFTVQGLFRQKRMVLDLRPQVSYQHPYAAIGFSGFDRKPPLPAAIQLNKIKLHIKPQHPHVSLRPITAKQPSLHIKYSPYKQSDFI